MTVPVAFLYDDSAYTETLVPAPAPSAERPVALVGRQVAGREFLEAYLYHGNYEELIGVVWNHVGAESLTRTVRQHPRAAKRPLKIVQVDRFLTRDPLPGQALAGGSENVAAPVLYTPCPPDPSFAWLRYDRGPASFAISGVTHTLSSAGAARTLGDLLTAPFEPFDALICTSRAVVNTVRAVTGAYAEYLGERFGSVPVLRPRLELIPLGVNPNKFRPPTPEERAKRRASLNIRPEAVAAFFMGRFTAHAKAHPFPMLQGLAQAVRITGKPVHLILSGWAANDAQLRVYLQGLEAFAPGLPVSVVNGLDPELRFGVWQAADLFTSMSDNVQETFGLVMVEAMASGLPVVATDWDGYRDLVVDGETGLLVPTYMVPEATRESTLRLLTGAIDYDHFLGECNQAVAVDVPASAAAYARLIEDPAMRQRMGAAGRERAVREFAWERVVGSYEQLWREQERELRKHTSNLKEKPIGPACYPAPEVSFAGYPTAWLVRDDRLIAAPAALETLPRILSSPLCTYGEQWMRSDAVLRAVLTEARTPRRLGELCDLLLTHNLSYPRAAATVAWLLKYGLLMRG